jgi:hypothetical protein
MVFMGTKLRRPGRDGFSKTDRLAELFAALPEYAAKSVRR